MRVCTDNRPGTPRTKTVLTDGQRRTGRGRSATGAQWQLRAGDRRQAPAPARRRVDTIAVSRLCEKPDHGQDFGSLRGDLRGVELEEPDLENHRRRGRRDE